MSSPSLSDAAVSLCIFSILLVPLAGAGLSLLDTGLGRSHSAAHTMLTALLVIAVAAAVYFSFGFAFQGYIGRSSYFFSFGGKVWKWIAFEPFFFGGLQLDGSSSSLAAWLQLFSVGIAAMIPLGSAAGRWRLGASCASTVFLSGCLYPLFAHWVWGGGWLAQLGANYGLGRGFVDAGGSGTIQAVGGLTALAIAWILGPRRGKFALEGIPTAIPGHNAVYVLFACLLSWVGWLGLNSAGAILFTGIEPGKIVLIAVNTTLSAVAALLAAAGVTRIRFGKPDASLCANGWFGGLVASSASCAFVSPIAAALIGLVAGILTTLTVEWFETRLAVDDPGGAISVHAMGGIWGLLAVGIFAQFPGTVWNIAEGSALAPRAVESGQWLAQIIGIATLLGFVLPAAYAFNWLLNKFYPQRPSADGERHGMDLHELGAGAYPDFVTNFEEFTQR